MASLIMIMSELETIIKNLESNNDVDAAFLAGSFVNDKRPYSDIDLIIVSPKFRGMEFRYRPVGFYKYWNLNEPFDFSITNETEVIGIGTRDLGQRVLLLGSHICEERANEHEHGSDIGKAEYLEGVLHLYPPEGSVFFFSNPIIKSSGSLEVSPFIETYDKRHYMGIYISGPQGNRYTLHRANIVPLKT